MMKKSSKLRVLILLLLAAMAAELVAMAAISRLSGVSPVLAALIDSALLAAMLAPVIYLLVIREMTALIRERESIKAMGQRNKLVFEALGEGVYGIDMSGNVMFVNKAAERILGYSEADLVGKHSHEIFHCNRCDGSKYDPKDCNIYATSRDGKVRRIADEVFWKKDGSPVPVEYMATPVMEEGKIAGVVIAFQDITERRKAEAEIRESYEVQNVLNTILRRSLTPLPLQQKLADHLAALFSIPWLAVQPKGAIFLVNGKTLNLTVQQGLAPSLLVACAKLPFGKCLCGRAAESGQVVTSSCLGPEHEIVYEGIVPHGHYCAPIIAAGKTLGVLNLYLKERTAITGKRKDFLRAVTDIIAADILRARVEEQFAHSQKMEAVGHMAGGVAHDFNNIITAILGYSDFLRAALPAGDPKRADVEEIRKAGERAAALTQQLLAFSRKQVVQFKVLNLDQIIPDIVKMVRRMIAEDIEFDTFLNSVPATVLSNQGQLGQVLMNLAVNARDAMPDGGKLTFETAQVELDANYAAEHPGVSPGRYVMLAVSDTGHGMSPEVTERIFEPFFTTKEQGKGTGLGLSTVYGIVKQSGGSIFVYSEPGKGTTFKIYLPVAADTAAGKAAQEPSLPSCRGTETILVVEDDESVRKLVGRTLSQSGYAVLEAATPREAIKLCELRRDIHLMLTDMIMPQMNGYELSKVTAALAPRMKVIFMSGYTDNVLPRHGLEPGMVFLEKPLNAETLLRTIREVLECRPHS